MKGYLIFFMPLIFIACELIETEPPNLSCILEHSTTVVKLESGLLGEDVTVQIILAWTWLLEKPSGDGIIIERSIADSLDFVAIDTLLQIDSVMSFTDDDAILQPDISVYYRLGLLSGGSVDYFKTAGFTVPLSQHFYQPISDTLGNDTLRIIFAQIPEFNSCNISVYKALSTNPESLVNLVNPVYDTSIIYPDTTITVYMPDSIFPDTTFYTIKLSSSESVELITDTSVGFRAFFKSP